VNQMGASNCCSAPSPSIESAAKISNSSPTICRSARTIHHDGKKKIDTMYEFDHTTRGVLSSTPAGCVLKAKHRKNQTYHAIKQLDKKNFPGKAWQEDVNSMCQLDHPHICKIFEVWEDHKHVYLVMELCGGGDLSTYGTTKQAKAHNEACVALLVRQMVGAIAHFHSGGEGGEAGRSPSPLIHGDIRLEHWLFAKPVINITSIIELNLKMIDYGIVHKHLPKKATKSPRRSQRMSTSMSTKDIRGAYCQAPEQLQGGEAATMQLSDVWALGVISYFLLSGKAPFQRNAANFETKLKSASFQFEPQEIWRPVTQDAKDFIKACLSANPQDRPTAFHLQGHEWMVHAKRVFDQELTGHAAPQGVFGRLSAAVGRQGEELPGQNSARSARSARAGKMSISDAPLPSAAQLVKSFKRMHSLNKIEKAAITTAAHRLPASSILYLQREFEKLDLNGDGVLSAQEIYEELKKTGIEADELMEILKDSDLDGSGHIEYTEFIAAAYDFQRNLQDSLIWSVFRAFDHDNSGEVTKRELLKMLKCSKEGKTMPEHTHLHASSTKSLEDVFGQEIFDSALDELDKDGDQKIDFKEFKKLLKCRE